MTAWAKLTALIFLTDVALQVATRVIIGAGAAAIERASRPPEPLLGLATTTELLEELNARFSVGHFAPEYRTAEP